MGLRLCRRRPLLQAVAVAGPRHGCLQAQAPLFGYFVGNAGPEALVRAVMLLVYL